MNQIMTTPNECVNDMQTLKTYRLDRIDFVDVAVTVRAFDKRDALERAKRGEGHALNIRRSEGDYVGDTREFDGTGLRSQITTTTNDGDLRAQMGKEGFVGVIQVDNADRQRAYEHAQSQIMDELSANNGSLDISLLSDSRYFFDLFAREIAANLGISEKDSRAGLLDALSE